jgi:propanediol utilization protein
MVKLDRGVIRHQRHVHMCQKEADFYGVRDGDFMKLRVVSDCPAIMEEVLVRVSQGAKLEVHIDTDEGNAVNLAKAKSVELFR